jgi:hypothetical protein
MAKLKDLKMKKLDGKETDLYKNLTKIVTDYKDGTTYQLSLNDLLTETKSVADVINDYFINPEKVLENGAKVQEIAQKTGTNTVISGDKVQDLGAKTADTGTKTAQTAPEKAPETEERKDIPEGLRIYNDMQRMGAEMSAGFAASRQKSAEGQRQFADLTRRLDVMDNTTGQMRAELDDIDRQSRHQQLDTEHTVWQNRLEEFGAGQPKPATMDNAPAQNPAQTPTQASTQAPTQRTEKEFDYFNPEYQRKKREFEVRIPELSDPNVPDEIKRQIVERASTQKYEDIQEMSGKCDANGNRVYENATQAYNEKWYEDYKKFTPRDGRDINRHINDLKHDLDLVISDLPPAERAKIIDQLIKGGGEIGRMEPKNMSAQEANYFDAMSITGDLSQMHAWRDNRFGEYDKQTFGQSRLEQYNQDGKIGFGAGTTAAAKRWEARYEKQKHHEYGQTGNATPREHNAIGDLMSVMNETKGGKMGDLVHQIPPERLNDVSKFAGALSKEALLEIERRREQGMGRE